jgi:GT2 family glycosyltransferase
MTNLLKLNELPIGSNAEDPWFFFDPKYYILQCSNAGIAPPIGSSETLRHHYLQRGANLGLSPNCFFDEDYYRRRYPDVGNEIHRGLLKNGFSHFIRFGSKSGLSPVWLFDGYFYRSMYPELTDEFLKFEGYDSLYSHYLHVGVRERRISNWMTRAVQLVAGRCEIANSLSQLSERMATGDGIPDALIPAFDVEWMKERYHWRDKIKRQDYPRYYLLNARAHKLSPSPYFNEEYYLEKHPEINEGVQSGAFVSGYQHFVLHGQSEMRDPFPGFDSSYYFQTNIANDHSPNADRNITPFVHFLRNRKSRPLSLAPTFGSHQIEEWAGKGIYERRCAATAPYLRHLTSSAVEHSNLPPDISIIIVVRDNFEQTANCILSVINSTARQLEFIVYDNGSMDHTQAILSRHPAIKYMRSDVNVGFTLAVNRAAQMSTGRTILLLNNDLEVGAGAVDIALSNLDRDPSIGAVGGKIIRMHGRMQECGSLVWKDGTCLGYGRDLDPASGQVSVSCDVDFCSGCFLMLRRSDWEALGGFDEAYAPAYYEEVDLCLRVWESGKRVFCDSRIIVWHYEYGSSSVREEALALMRRNQRYFTRKHKKFLTNAFRPSSTSIEAARLRHVSRPRILFIEDRIPDAAIGMGYSRSAAVMHTLSGVAGLVSCLGLHNSSWQTSYYLRSEGNNIEYLSGVNVNTTDEFFSQRRGVYDIVWLSRTHNLAHLDAWKEKFPDFFSEVAVVLDTEAVAATRNAAYAEQLGMSVDVNALVTREFELVHNVDHICAVNALDRALIRSALERQGLDMPVSIIGSTNNIVGAPSSFTGTADIVLFGSFSQPDSPNADAVIWFDREIYPRIKNAKSHRFVLAGNEAERFARQANLQHKYHIVNNPSDMGDVFRNARVMVAPTRFAAGVPIKVYDAASYGTPVVMSDILARQLGWQTDGVMMAALDANDFALRIDELLSSEEIWNNIQTRQLRLVQRDCHPTRFQQAVNAIVRDIKTESSSIGDFIREKSDA